MSKCAGCTGSKSADIVDVLGRGELMDVLGKVG